jgi:hypothetical protein
MAAAASESCAYENRPIFDRWGRVVGYRRAQYC